MPAKAKACDEKCADGRCPAELPSLDPVTVDPKSGAKGK
jgi:hypothetical protein